MTTSDTPETLSNPESEAKVRLLPAEVPVFIDLAETEEGNSRVVGSLYVGDMTQFAEHNPSSEDSGRFDILDLRRAPKDRYGNKLYDGRSFDPKTEFLVIQGIPDWDTGKGYVELPDDGVLTIGRKDPVSSKRFDVSSKYISREHVTIGYTDGKLVLQDEKSSNGTTFVEYPLGPSSRQIDDGAYDEGSRAIEISKQENIPVTLTEEEVGTWRDYLQYNEKAQTIAVQEMLSNPELVPTAGIVIDDMTFLLTDILENESTRLAMGYVASPNDKGVFKHRLFYHSVSDGSWRAASGIEINPKIRYIKGSEDFEEREFGQYVQETKLNEYLARLLDKQEADKLLRSEIGTEALVDLFGSNDPDKLRQRFGHEAQNTFVEGKFLDAYIPARGFSNGTQSRYDLERVELPGGFEPNFSTEPTREYTMKHMSLGESVVEVFPARLQGREVEWHIAHDREGRVWVDKIIYVDGHTTTYGTYAEVINAGALSAKPLEYTHQIEGMVMGEDWEKRYSYADITKTIDRIPSIYRYRQARGVFRVQ